MPPPCPLDAYLALSMRHFADQAHPAASHPGRLCQLDGIWLALPMQAQAQAARMVRATRAGFRVSVSTMHTSGGDQHIVRIDHPDRPVDASLFETNGTITPYESPTLENAQAEARAWQQFLAPTPSWNHMLAGYHLDPVLASEEEAAQDNPAARDPGILGQAVLQVLASAPQEGVFVGLLRQALAMHGPHSSPEMAAAQFLAVLHAPHRAWSYGPDWKFVHQVAAATDAHRRPARKAQSPA